MKKNHALLDFSQYLKVEKLAFCYNVIAKLTNNPDFTSPEAPVQFNKFTTH
jgi:hypothetical protein